MDERVDIMHVGQESEIGLARAGQGNILSNERSMASNDTDNRAEKRSL